MPPERIFIVAGSSAQGTWLLPFNTEGETTQFLAAAYRLIFTTEPYISAQLGKIEWAMYPSGLDTPSEAVAALLSSLKKD